MALAVMAGNVLALVYTIVFARKLGQTGYGSLSALISTYIILMGPGAAVQTTVAREVSAAFAAGDPHAGAGVRRWLEGLVLATIGVAAQWVLGTVGWWSVAVANVLAVLAMGWQVWRTHPMLPRRLLEHPQLRV